MGLENLLLIVSHCDFGYSDCTGSELFKCVIEQSKSLLCELQQAVRASFPPEELLGEHAVGPAATPCVHAEYGDLCNRAVCDDDRDSQWSDWNGSNLERG